jgi:hypothetical protein
MRFDEDFDETETEVSRRSEFHSEYEATVLTTQHGIVTVYYYYYYYTLNHLILFPPTPS